MTYKPHNLFPLEVRAKDATSSAVLHLTGAIGASILEAPSLVSLAVNGSTSGSTGIVADSTSSIRASKLTLAGTALGSFGTQASPLIASTPELTMNTAGSVFVGNGNSVTITNSTAGSSTSKAPVAVSVETLLGTITLGGGIEVKGTNTSISLKSNGIAVSAGVKDRLIADSIALDGTNSGGSSSIGSLTNPVLTQASKGLGASTQGDVFLNNNGNASILTSTLSGGSTYFLTNRGNVNGAGPGGLITAGNVIISATGSIGTSSNSLNVDATNLTLSASGEVYASDATNGLVNLKNQTVGSLFTNRGTIFTITSPNATQLSVIDPVSSREISLSSNSIKTDAALKATNKLSLVATTGGITINDALTSDSISLSAVGANQTIGQSSKGVITARQLDVSLSEGTADLQNADNLIKGFSDSVSGAGKIDLRTLAKMTMSFDGSLQDINIFYTDQLTISGRDKTVNSLIATPTQFSLDNVVTIQSGMIDTDLTRLIASGRKGRIDLKGSLTGTGDKELQVDGGRIEIEKQLSGGHVTLTTDGGDVYENKDFGAIFADELSLEMRNGGRISLVGNGNRFGEFDNTLIGGYGVVSIYSSSDVILSRIVGDQLDLTVSSAGNISTPSTIQARALVLSAGGDEGIGSVGQRVTTTASSIEILASGDGANAYVTTTGTDELTIVDADADGILDITAAGGIVSKKAEITADQISLKALGGGIDISGNLGRATTSALYEALGPITLRGLVSGSDATFISSGGSISGGKPKDGIDLNVNSVSATTGGAGFVSLESVSSNFLILNNSSSGQSFSVTTPGKLIVNNIVTNAGVDASTGSISLISTKGDIVLNSNADLKAIGGNILISARPKTATVTIGAGANLLGSSTVDDVGHVTINTGAAARNENGPTPGDVTVDETLGGKVYFGKNGITVSAPNNTLKAEGRDIDFSGDTVDSIVLGGGVTITADPPVGSAAHAALVAAMASSAQLLDTAATSGVLSSNSSSQQNGATSNVSFSRIDQVVRNVDQTPIFTGNLTASDSALSASAAALSSTANSVDQLGLGGFVPLLTHGMNRFAVSTDSINLIEAVQLCEVPRSKHRSSDHRASSIESSGILVGHVDRGHHAESELQSGHTVTRTSLKCGNMICSPEASPAVLDTAFGVVKVAPGSIVLAIANDDGLAIYNLDDNHKGAVTLEHECRKFDVAPGGHLFVTHRDTDYASVNVHERILYSAIQKSKLSNGHHVFHGQFFIPSAIEAVRPLLELVTARDSHSRAKANRLIKTTAILLQLNGGMSNYQPHIRPRATALN